MLVAIAAMLAVLCRPVLAAEDSLESAPPVVVKTVPAAGATDVDPGLTEIKVTYSKAMQDGSWSWSTWGEESYPETTGQARYLSDGRTCVLPVKLQPAKFYAIWLNSDKFKNFTDVSGRPAVPYLLTFYTGDAAAMTSSSPAKEIDAKIAQLARAGTPVEDALRLLGEPKQYLWGKESFKKDNLPATYILQYPGGVNVVVSHGRVTELRSERPGPGFSYRGNLRLGSSLDDMLQVVGAPSETVVGKPLEFQPGVLYRDIDGKKGYCYYARPDQQILCFFLNNYISALYLTLGKGRDFAPGNKPATTGGPEKNISLALLNDDQRAVLAWTDRQFRSFFDERTFDGWSDEERAALEKKLIDSLSGPRSTEYYQAINTLAALKSTSALPKLSAIAFERVDRNNRDRWMAIRSLGLIGDKSVAPELIHLVYHGNVNTRWWAQISLVRITGQNFAKDWNAWGNWWNGQNGQPPYKPELIRWWNGQAEPDKLAESLEEGDQKFFESLKDKSAAAPAATSSTEVAARLRMATPVMEGIRGAWSAVVEAIQREDMTSALASLKTLTPRIEEFRDTMKGTSLEAGVAESLETLKPLMNALEKGDKDTTQTALAAMMAQGRKMEQQVKAVTDASPVPTLR